ncbi:hypothetical protein M0D21_09610 [Aquimarina sp. D1M17]|uniref:hypothetical protein n=1 Tax=Aquimarina acroporae TaxID=2937283 RepID=UPI0020BF6B92|nr:hypothetical protein [Aquimarina acroporae]MCK8521827.1 hypothetical protein [Aquimarina acroporae]
MFILLIIMAAMVPVPVFLQKKQGKFNDDHLIEQMEQKENDDESSTKKLDENFKF